MAVHDRWYKTVKHSDGTKETVPSAEYGKGYRWQVRWRNEEGQQRKANFERKASANRYDAKVRSDLVTGSYVDPRAGRVTLKSYAEQWRKGLTSDPLTITQVTSRLTVWVYPLIGHHSLVTLAKRPSLVQRWIKDMEAHLEASTIQGIVGIVSTVFGAAIDDGLIHRNPCSARSVKSPRVAGKRVVPWTLEQVNAMSAAVPQRLAPMLYVGAGCGHRQGEMFGLALEDVDFLGRVIRVVRQVRLVDGCLVFSLPKGGKTREVPLPDEVGLRLGAHIQAYSPTPVTLPWKKPTGVPNTATLLFTTPEGQALNRTDFNRMWRAARRAAGIPLGRDNGTHVLRHTAASAWLASGVDIRTVAEYLGHSDPGFTLRVYSHLMPNAADRARKAMDAFFHGASSASALNVPSGGL